MHVPVAERPARPLPASRIDDAEADRAACCSSMDLAARPYGHLHYKAAGEKKKQPAPFTSDLRPNSKGMNAFILVKYTKQ